MDTETVTLIRMNKGRKSCEKCGATGLFWHQSRKGNWVLFETIACGSGLEDRAHFAYCGDPSVEQATTPGGTVPQVSDAEREAIHEMLQYLAGRCDGAVTRDDHGFSKWDARFGRSLARAERLSDRMAQSGRKLCQKYRRQLQEAGFDPGQLSAQEG